MGIFPRITKETITATFEDLSVITPEAVQLFINEQPVIAQAMTHVCQQPGEFETRMSAMAFIYRALEKQVKLG